MSGRCRGFAPLSGGVLAALVLSSGCVTITRGASESFVIETTPAGATATLSTGETCTTPCSVQVRRRGEFSVTVERDGYESHTTIVRSNVDGIGAAGMAGNIVLGGVGGVGFIGAGVDLASGATHTHSPNPLIVELLAIE